MDPTTDITHAVRRPGRPVKAALLACALTGCATPPLMDTAGTGLHVAVRRPVPLPAGSAHASFQGGRVVRAASLFEPFCELEVNTVAPERRALAVGRYRVSRVTHRLLRDPITRIPAMHTGFDCDDGVFQESLWRLAPAVPTAGADARHLRCIAPYYHCRFGPPLSVDQVQLVVGAHLAIDVSDP
jgi:hypothetical protein